jgi:hypothetical protein
VSNIFLFRGPDGLSLGFMHDVPNDGTGGAAHVTFTGLPTLPSLEPGGLPEGGSWVVQDDANGNPCGADTYSRTDVSWVWGGCCTDGGAFRGGLDGSFYVEIGAEFQGIDEWDFLTGDPAAPTRIPLSLDEPVYLIGVRESLPPIP